MLHPNRKYKPQDQSEQKSNKIALLLLFVVTMAIYFILPPHLAFGVAGDSYRIPPYSVLVYDIEVVDIKHNGEDADNDIVL